MAVSCRAAFIGLIGAVLLLTACMGLLIAQRNPAPTVRLEIDQPAPAIDLRDSSGRIVSLPDLINRVTVLYFSSDKCPISTAYSERVAALAGRYSSQNVLFLRIEPPDNDPCQESNPVPIQTLYDRDGVLAARYNVKVTPTFFVIGPRGRLRYSGAFDDNRDAAKVTIEYCRNAIQSVLDNEALATTSTSAFGSVVNANPPHRPAQTMAK